MLLQGSVSRQPLAVSSRTTPPPTTHYPLPTTHYRCTFPLRLSNRTSMHRRLCRAMLCLAALAGSPLMAQNTLNLMPVPAHLEIGTGKLVVDSGFQVSISSYSDSRLEAAVGRARERLERKLGVAFTRAKPKGAAELVVDVQGPGQK